MAAYSPPEGQCLEGYWLNHVDILWTIEVAALVLIKKKKRKERKSGAAHTHTHTHTHTNHNHASSYNFKIIEDTCNFPRLYFDIVHPLAFLPKEARNHQPITLPRSRLEEPLEKGMVLLERGTVLLEWGTVRLGEQETVLLDRGTVLLDRGTVLLERSWGNGPEGTVLRERSCRTGEWSILLEGGSGTDHQWMSLCGNTVCGVTCPHSGQYWLPVDWSLVENVAVWRWSLASVTRCWV